MRLHHVGLIVADLDVSAAFYEDVLGLCRDTRPELGFDGIYYALDGGAQIHLMRIDNPYSGYALPAHGGRDRHLALALPDLERILRATPTGAQIPISEVAKVSFSRGPAMIRDEDGSLTGYVFLDLKTSDYGTFVQKADSLLRQKLILPTGYTYRWSGQYEFEVRAKKRLEFILPVVFFMIFLLLYLSFRSVAEAVILFLPVFFALTGGLLLQWQLGYNFSVAAAVGYITLFGIAVETAVVMVVYLHEAMDNRIASGRPLTAADVEAATTDGAVLRLRPKLMTVFAVICSLAPILWETGTGSDVMKPIAAPVVGGMVTSMIGVLLLVPVLFSLLKEHQLRHGTLVHSQDKGKSE